MAISLKQMRYAVAVAEAGHFGRAAAQCNISQPALSQQVAQLEALCGTPLFDRLKTGVRLTPFGADFVERARAVLEGAEALSAFAERRSADPDRHLRFGLIPTVAPYLLPEIFPSLTARLPQLRFAVSESRTEALLAGLSDGSLDLALIATDVPASGPRLTQMPLLDDPFMLATPREERPATPVSLAALPADRILLLDEGHCLRDQAIAACRLPDRGTARTFAATSLSTIVEFVANGQGVTLLPRIALRKEGSDARIAVHAIKDAGASRTLSLVWREGSPFKIILQQIGDVIRDAVSNPISAAQDFQ